MKERFIIFINLTFQHFCLYWSQFSIAAYMRCQLIITLHFDFSKQFSAVFVIFFEFFSTLKRKKMFLVQRKEIIVLLAGALSQS